MSAQEIRKEGFFTMKRIFKTVAVAAISAAICLSMAACGNSSSTASVSPSASEASSTASAVVDPTASAAAATTLEGTYALVVDDAYLTAIGKDVATMTDDQKTQAKTEAAITATFAADGTFTALAASKNMAGTYTFDGTNIALTAGGKTAQYIYDAASDSFSTQVKGVTAVFARQA